MPNEVPAFCHKFTLWPLLTSSLSSRGSERTDLLIGDPSELSCGLLTNDKRGSTVGSAGPESCSVAVQLGAGSWSSSQRLGISQNLVSFSQLGDSRRVSFVAYLVENNNGYSL